MSNKERTAMHCRQLLEGRQLTYTFCPSVLESYYRKYNGSQANAFTLALKICDLMIEQYRPQPSPELEQYDPFF